MSHSQGTSPAIKRSRPKKAKHMLWDKEINDEVYVKTVASSLINYIKERAEESANFFYHKKVESLAAKINDDLETDYFPLKISTDMLVPLFDTHPLPENLTLQELCDAYASKRITTAEFNRKVKKLKAKDVK